jgi:hypothetical protein
MPLITIDQWIIDWFPWLVPVLEWINWAWDWIDMLLRDTVLWLIQALGDGLKEISKAINKARHWANQAIADFINAPGGGILALIIALNIGGAIIGLGSLLVETGAWAAVVKFLEDAEKGVLGFFDATFFKVLTTINKLLTFVWSDYRDAWKVTWEAIAAISADLGYATEFLQNMVGIYRAMAYGICSIAGFGPELIETEFTNVVTDFLKDMDAAFDKYNENPEQLLVDFDAWMYSKMFDNYTGQWTAMREGLVTINTTLDNAVKAIDGLDNALEKTRNDFDAEVQAAIDSWWKWVHDDWEWWLENTWNVYLDTVQGIFDIIDESVKNNTDRIAELEGKWGYPILAWYDEKNNDNAQYKKDMISFSDMLKNINGEVTGMATAIISREMRKSGFNEIKDTSIESTDYFPPVGAYIPDGKQENIIPSTAGWFVGE